MRRPDYWGLLAAGTLAALSGALVVVRELFDLRPLPMLAGIASVLAVVVAVVIVLVRHGLAGVAIILLGLGVMTSSWNAVAIGGIAVTHAALALAAVVLAGLAIGGGLAVRTPAWVWVLGAAISVITVSSLVWPPSAAYFASRNANGLPAALAHIDVLGPAGLAAGLKWLVGVVALPVAVCVAAPGRPRLVPALADAWTAGVTLSAAVAVTDGLGVTRIGRAILPLVDFVGRQAGLSVHPNHLAVSIVMALPLAVWRLARARRPRSALWPSGAALVMVGGLVMSGSRAGLVGAILAVLLALVVEPRTRRLMLGIAGPAGVGTIMVLLAAPSLLGFFGKHFRLDGSGGADASDAIRAGLAAQAWADFAHSPVYGTGFAVLAQGHNIYLQALASGGLILLVGYLLSQLGFLLDAWSMPESAAGLGRALAVSGGCFLVVGVVSNQLADVFVQVPFALVAGLWAALPDHRSSSVPDPVPEQEEIHS